MSRLHADSITKSFNEQKVLGDVCLICDTGSVTGLLGRNGTGKSTLMKIISGTVKGDSQFIRVDDKVMISQPDRRGNLSYLPQHSFLPREVKVKNLIPLFCLPESAVQLSGLSLIQPFLHETVRSLSGGEKRLVEVLLILYGDSKFILLDEPFSGLSPKTTEVIKGLIREQSRQKGIIISDHRFRDVLDISDETYLLSGTCLKKIKDFKELQQYNYLPENI